MSTKGLFTRIQNALANPRSYTSFQKELDTKAVEEAIFNRFSGKSVFLAVVLPGDVGSSTAKDKKIIRVRPLDLHDFILPEPCDYSGQPNKMKKILSMHPVAYPDSSYKFLGGNLEGVDPVAYGHIVECFYEDGPQNSGRQRGLTYRPSTIGIANKLDLSCLGIVAKSSNQEEGDDTYTRGARRKKVNDAAKNFDSSTIPYEPPPPSMSVGPWDLTPDSKAYVEAATEDNIKDYSTKDGAVHSPRKRVYNGIVEEFKGKTVLNGLMPPALLGQLPPGVIKLFSHPRRKGIMLLDVLPDFQRLAVAYEMHFGKKLALGPKPSGDSYRTFNAQVTTKNGKIARSKVILSEITEGMSEEKIKEIKARAAKKVGEAAAPGTSNHGWGLAFDFYAEKGFADPGFSWMLTNAPRFGFEIPRALRNGRGVEEFWHVQWIKSRELLKIG